MAYSIIHYLFNEELGMIIEVPNSHKQQVQNCLQKYQIDFQIIAYTTKGIFIFVRELLIE